MRSFRKHIIYILAMILISVSFFGCKKQENTKDEPSDKTLYGYEFKSELDIKYAKEYSVSLYKGGMSKITIGEDEILLFDEGTEIPENIDRKKYIVVKKPLNSIYNASSSTMDYFLYLNEIDRVTMTSTKEEDWSVPEIAQRIKDEDIVYVGKYSSPDFEYILDDGCQLVVENQMILHSPATKEKLEALGLPLIVERSSLEEEPLGRLEWIKLYGLLTDKLDAAEGFFAAQVNTLEETKENIRKEIETDDTPAPSAVFFYVNSAGIPAVRNPKDYMSKLIKIAGFLYSFDGALEDSGKSFINIQMEEFFEKASDTDLLIYNASFEDPPKNTAELLAKDKLFGELKAVQEGNVWCFSIDIFQKPTLMAEVVKEMYILRNCIKTGSEPPELTYFYRLK